MDSVINQAADPSFIIFYILVAAHGANMGYGLYGTTDNDNKANRNMQHNIKSHHQVSSSGQIDNTARPLEEMPYQV